MTDKKILIWLTSFDFMSAKKILTLLEYYESEENILNAFEKNDNVLRQMFNQDQITKIQNCASRQHINNYYQNLVDMNIVAVTYKDDAYPESLKNIADFPVVIYTKGDLNLLKTKCLAVVGTRNTTNYGKTVTYDIVKNLAKSGLTIVSGMASGVDSISHKATLEAGGKTIAVLGSGFNEIYPKMNENLANEIANKGLLISEYPPNFRAQKFSFIARNRIIAGLSQGVLITEASKTSGSMHTKNFAYDYNRNVYALPGNINSSQSEGTNMLIATSQAQCVLGYKDIIKDFGIEDNIKQKVFELNFDEQNIYNCLKKEPYSFDNLQIQTQIEAKKLNSYLTTLAIRGIIKKLPGNMFSV